MLIPVAFPVLNEPCHLVYFFLMVWMSKRGKAVKCFYESKEKDGLKMACHILQGIRQGIRNLWLFFLPSLPSFVDSNSREIYVIKWSSLSILLVSFACFKRQAWYVFLHSYWLIEIFKVNICQPTDIYYRVKQ